MDEQRDMILSGSNDLAPVDMFGGSTGFEAMDRECTIIPFLKLAQASTEQAKRGAATQIEGLQVGQFFSPATKKVYGDSIDVVLLKFYRTFLVYESRELNAKIIGSISAEVFHSDVEPNSTRERSYWLDAQGHRYVDTRNFIVLPFRTPNDGPMLFSLASTGIKPSRELLAAATAIKARNPKPDGEGFEIVPAPLWSSVWKLTPSYFDNDQGGYYQITGIERLGWVPLAMAPEVRKLFDDLQDVEVSPAEPQGEQGQAPDSQAGRAVENVFGPKSKPEPKIAPKNPPKAPAPDTAAGSDEDQIV